MLHGGDTSCARMLEYEYDLNLFLQDFDLLLKLSRLLLKIKLFFFLFIMPLFSPMKHILFNSCFV